MYREPLNNLQIIEYLKRTKEDTTIEEHRMALDASIRVFEKEKPEITLEQMQELFDFLRGKLPDSMSIVKKNMPILRDDQAFSIIWYIQEHLGRLPDKFELCHECKQIYDTDCGGIAVDFLRDAKEMGYNCTRKDRGHTFCSDCR